MRVFSAQYVITNAGKILKRPVITTGDDGTIIKVTDTGGHLVEQASVEFHNGVIVPGFINTHCHLELSYLKGQIKPGAGLGAFLMAVNTLRDSLVTDKTKHFSTADEMMFSSGVIACADICNSPLTFDFKTKCRIKYINLLEIFGINRDLALTRLNDLEKLSAIASGLGLEHYPVPHSTYSLSLTLFRMLREVSLENKVTSIHFMESADEARFLAGEPCSIADNYKIFLPGYVKPETVRDHADAILNEITSSGNLILVHNTHVGQADLDRIAHRKNIYFCLCPNSNLYISGQLPPLDLLITNRCKITLGTDSLSSNTSLNMLEEMKTLQFSFPYLSLETIISWASLNGAMALGLDREAGSIVPGKKPGLVLIRDADLSDLRLMPGSTSVRLI
ncbi:MAG: amidohydrolase family protein [Bacteroidales bacterium]